MSFKEIIDFNNTLTKNKKMTLAEVYGKEKFCYFIYSLIKMQQPEVVVELGTGLGTCSLLMGQALKENNKGKLLTVDNGKDWDSIKTHLNKKYKSHEEFFNDVLNKFKLKDFIQFEKFDLEIAPLINPNKPIDLLFCDALDTGPLGCIKILKSYLPLMNNNSSIFIDRASTINHSYLMLENIINSFNNNKIPQVLLANLTQEEIQKINEIVGNSKFNLVHLVENMHKKVNKLQNSTTWIKIEPVDVLFTNNVYNSL